MAITSVVVFDVNETLSDMAPIATRFDDVGLPGELTATWFAAVLRDGFALATAGASAPFAVIADGVLRGLLAEHGADGDAHAAVRHVLDSFSQLDVHPDVVPGVQALADAGLRLVALTNGSVETAHALLTRAGVRDHFEEVLGVEATSRWKPSPESYAYAAATCDVTPGQMLLVAVHPWDVDGAARAGLRSAWIDRTGKAPFPTYLTPPDLRVAGVVDLAGRLVESPAGT